jgi:cytoskeletal protein RodZ
MNRKFIFSMSVAMSFILGLGFVIVSQTALAVQFTYPYSSSNYNKAYSPNNNTSSSYDSASYNKAYSPNNNTSSSYDSASYNKAYSPYNIDKNDKYPDSYIKSTEFSKYPTLDKIYECQTGPLEGFFTSSVEFCIAATENVR